MRVGGDRDSDPVATVTHQRAELKRCGRTWAWWWVRFWIGHVGYPVCAHALCPVEQPPVSRCRGRLVGNALLREQTLAGGLSSFDRRGGQVDPCALEIEATVRSRVREVRYPVGPHAARVTQPRRVNLSPSRARNPRRGQTCAGAGAT